MKYQPNLAKRIFATLIDYGLYTILSWLYVEYFGHDVPDGGKTVEGLAVLPLILYWFIYFPLVENAFAAPFGGLIFNLRVLTIHNREIGLSQSIKRHICDCIDFFLFEIPALIAIKNTDKHQRLGYLWAKTIVVNLRDP